MTLQRHMGVAQEGQREPECVHGHEALARCVHLFRSVRNAITDHPGTPPPRRGWMSFLFHLDLDNTAVRKTGCGACGSQCVVWSAPLQILLEARPRGRVAGHVRE